MKKKKASTDEMYKLYQDGLSLEKVGNIFGMTRQSVYERFKRRNLSMRPKFRKPYLIIDDLKFTINKDGYYECTTVDRLMLHNYIYEKEVRKIPINHVIHHIDGNKLNNNPSNLMPMTPESHSSLHNEVPGWNGMSKKVKCIETGEVFSSITEVAKKHNKHPSNVSRYYIDEGRKINGFTYEKIN